MKETVSDGFLMAGVIIGAIAAVVGFGRFGRETGLWAREREPRGKRAMKRLRGERAPAG
jgi:hypothetical protein